jgi:large subunit ribosomal protein L18e
VQLYAFLVRRTDSKFNKVVLKRLFMSRTNRPPLSLSKLATFMKGKVRTAHSTAVSLRCIWLEILVCNVFTRAVLQHLASWLLLAEQFSKASLRILLQEDKTAVLVGTVTDDVRLFEVPKLTVVAMRVTETARARILGVSCPISAVAHKALLL